VPRGRGRSFRDNARDGGADRHGDCPDQRVAQTAIVSRMLGRILVPAGTPELDRRLPHEHRGHCARSQGETSPEQSLVHETIMPSMARI
jgi:hypothetical protein